DAVKNTGFQLPPVGRFFLKVSEYGVVVGQAGADEQFFGVVAELFVQGGCLDPAIEDLSQRGLQCGFIGRLCGQLLKEGQELLADGLCER
ncbi:MAG: hypothetical protein ACKPJJ_26815, partial [Planctomycetaceae bacterium]